MDRESISFSRQWQTFVAADSSYRPTERKFKDTFNLLRTLTFFCYFIDKLEILFVFVRPLGVDN